MAHNSLEMERSLVHASPAAESDVSATELDVEFQGGNSLAQTGKRVRISVALVSSVFLAAALWAMIADPYPVQKQADVSSIASEVADGGICFITIYHACGCANCDAHVSKENGDEACFSTVAVKDTDDDNGHCHEHRTKCTLKVGQKYTAKCTGDWDSGARLQIGGLEFCNKKEETKEFVAKASPPVPPLRQQYEQIMDAKTKKVMKQYGWSRSLRECISDAERIDGFKDSKADALDWDGLDSALKTAISMKPSCDAPQKADGMYVLKACVEKTVADHDSAQDEGDDW